MEKFLSDFNESEYYIKASIDSWLWLDSHSTITLFMTSSNCANRTEAVLESLLAGKSRLLYYCVWIVYVNQRTANPASPLDERPEWSKFATKASIA